MVERTACDDVVWQNWLSLIVANNGKKVVFPHNNVDIHSLYE